MAKPVVEDHQRISAHALWLSARLAGDDAGAFSSAHFEICRGTTIQAVGIELTPCRYGGSRAYFRCPSEGCGRRVANLFSGGGEFLCRQCLGLAYRSQQLRPAARLMQRRDKIAAPLRVENWFAFPAPRPNGMQHRTYERLVAKAAEAHCRGMIAWWGALAYRRVVKAL